MWHRKENSPASYDCVVSLFVQIRMYANVGVYEYVPNEYVWYVYENDTVTGCVLGVGDVQYINGTVVVVALLTHNRSMQICMYVDVCAWIH